MNSVGVDKLVYFMNFVTKAIDIYMGNLDSTRLGKSISIMSSYLCGRFLCVLG